VLKQLLQQEQMNFLTGQSEKNEKHEMWWLMGPMGKLSVHEMRTKYRLKKMGMKPLQMGRQKHLHHYYCYRYHFHSEDELQPLTPTNTKQ